MPPEQGSQQQIGERPSNGVGGDIGIAQKIQLDQTGKFPAEQH